MTRSTTLYLVPVLLAAAAHAGEFTIAPCPFAVSKSFSAAVVPADGQVLLQTEPKSWADFQIAEIAAHGRRVAKGEPLVRFETEAIEHKLTDARRAHAAGALALAQAEADFKHLQETSTNKLEAQRRAAAIAKEENAYFTQTRRKAEEEAATQALELKKQALENEKEELRQLTKMYQADDLTEETEEIILTRQKNDVAGAELGLRLKALETKRTLEVLLPREALTLADAERDSTLALAKAEQDIPRAIELKKLDLQALQTAHQRDKDALAELEHDRTLFEITAPADGWFYHGVIDQGRWTTGENVKALVKHGRPTINRPFATFVPASAKLALVAQLSEADARALQSGVAGNAACAGRDEIEIPVKLDSLATIPGVDGTYRADLTAAWPDKFSPVAGSSTQVRLIAYHQPAAIVVPTKALSSGASGWTIDVKLADGKPEPRPVQRGRVSGENTEILAGLEVGQVIITPDK